MAGAMRKMGVYLGLVEDDDWGDADYGHVPAQSAHTGGGHSSRSDYASRADYAETRYNREPAYARHGEVATVTREREYVDEYERSLPPEDTRSYQITTLHPRTYNEARTIGEHFRKNTPVIMNLSEMDDADAKRLVDFAAGLTFGLHGRIERVTAKVFLLSPHNVSVTAADKARIVETGFFNQS
jgi:cell division inhibitor SepF